MGVLPASIRVLFFLRCGTGTPRTVLSGIHACCEQEKLIGKACIAVTDLPPQAMPGVESRGMFLIAVQREGEEEKLRLLTADPHVPAGAKPY